MIKTLRKLAIEDISIKNFFLHHNDERMNVFLLILGKKGEDSNLISYIQHYSGHCSKARKGN